MKKIILILGAVLLIISCKKDKPTTPTYKGSAKIYITGAGYSNVEFNYLANGNTTCSSLLTNNKLTTITFRNNEEATNVFLSLSFEGLNTGQYECSDSINAICLIGVIGNFYSKSVFYPDLPPININITKYGSVDNIVKGTFEGILTDFNYYPLDSVRINITGSFSALRLSDI